MGRARSLSSAVNRKTQIQAEQEAEKLRPVSLKQNHRQIVLSQVKFV